VHVTAAHEFGYEDRAYAELDGSPPRCGGRLRVIATVQDPLAVQAILTYLARSGAPAPPGPAPPAPAPLT
jgi:hypothetical protein